MTVLNALTKTAGVIGLGLVAYDSHMLGKHEAGVHSANVKNDGLTERYLDDLKMDGPSHVQMKAKEGIFKYFLDEKLSMFFTSIGGYFKGFSEMLVKNVIPFGLAAGTILGGGIKGKGVGGVVSKFCGAGLVLYGAAFLAEELLGIGKHE